MSYRAGWAIGLGGQYDWVGYRAGWAIGLGEL